MKTAVKCCDLPKSQFEVMHSQGHAAILVMCPFVAISLTMMDIITGLGFVHPCETTINW